MSTCIIIYLFSLSNFCPVMPVSICFECCLLRSVTASRHGVRGQSKNWNIQLEYGNQNRVDLFEILQFDWLVVWQLHPWLSDVLLAKTTPFFNLAEPSIHDLCGVYYQVCHEPCLHDAIQIRIVSGFTQRIKSLQLISCRTMQPHVASIIFTNYKSFIHCFSLFWARYIRLTGYTLVR